MININTNTLSILFGITIIIIIVIMIMTTVETTELEHMNEGTYQYMEYPRTNFSSYLYPICQKNVRNNGLNERYCDDKHNPFLGLQRVFKDGKWVVLKYPSFYYPAYAMYNDKKMVYSPDYYHNYS